MEQIADTHLAVLVPAAGMGLRLGLGPKAFLEIDGRPLLAWLAKKLLRVANEVVIAVPPGDVERAQSMCPGCTCIGGASSRQETVELLLQASSSPVVLIQDLARPFCSADLVRSVGEAALVHGVAGAFWNPNVPVARIGEGQLVEQAWPAAGMAVFQAPQAFQRAVLVRTFKLARDHEWRTQSTLELVLAAGESVFAVPGEVQNIKITTLQDWQLAQHLKAYLV